MKWQGRRRSSHVEDRRGMRGRTGLVGGGIGTIVILLIALFLGVDPSALMQMGEAVAPTEQAPAALPPESDTLAQFISVVLADTEETWNTLFAEEGRDYPEPTLVLFSDAVRSACGSAQAAVGPFYCPTDQKVYIDLSFYRDLQERFGAPGDFAQAYVIAHEVGHHVQTVLGISGQVDAVRRRGGQAEGNRLSVMQELQADCFAGIWAHHAQRARDLLERGDVEEALTAAAAIGDDRLQRQSGGQVVPESFTHGTSEQRVRWFRTGLEAGSLDRCDTFSATRL
jgi:uncharacterized protein